MQNLGVNFENEISPSTAQDLHVIWTTQTYKTVPTSKNNPPKTCFHLQNNSESGLQVETGAAKTLFKRLFDLFAFYVFFSPLLANSRTTDHVTSVDSDQ